LAFLSAERNYLERFYGNRQSDSGQVSVINVNRMCVAFGCTPWSEKRVVNGAANCAQVEKGSTQKRQNIKRKAATVSHPAPGLHLAKMHLDFGRALSVG
jgi:hypothetical protein